MRVPRIVVALVVVAVLCLAPTAPAAPPATGAPIPLPAGWTSTTVSITVGGLARSYLLIRPRATSTTPLPVLVDLQGCCTTPEVEAQRSGFVDVTGPAILVYPAGYRQSWNAGFSCHQAQADDVDDVAFLTAVVNQVLAGRPDAAARQVYLAGYSNGGRMALRMAYAASQLFTAVASYGAVSAAPCPDPAPVPLLDVAGTADPELTIGPGGTPQRINGYTEPTVHAQVDQYRRADGTPPPAPRATSPAPSRRAADLDGLPIRRRAAVAVPRRRPHLAAGRRRHPVRRPGHVGLLPDQPHHRLRYE